MLLGLLGTGCLSSSAVIAASGSGGGVGPRVRQLIPYPVAAGREASAVLDICGAGRSACIRAFLTRTGSGQKEVERDDQTRSA